MDTNQTSNDLNHPPTDPALDALLDQAVSHGAPPMDPKLSRRIVAQTLPMLPRRGGVLARITSGIVPGGAPTLMRVAAAVAIIVGAWVAVTVMNQDRGTVPQQPLAVNNQSEDQFAAIELELEQIDRAVEQGNTRIDEQMDVLALRIDLASAEGVWGTPGQDTSERLSDAVTGFEFDLFSADAMLLMDDGSALF